jgi:hypothetical protein
MLERLDGRSPMCQIFLSIHSIHADHANLPQVFGIKVQQSAFADQRQAFFSVHFGSIGRISEAEIRLLMERPLGG